MVGLWGKPFLVGVRSVRAGLKKMTLAVPALFTAEVMWAGVSVCFSGESFPFFFPLLNVSFGANFNHIEEINL